MNGKQYKVNYQAPKYTSLNIPCCLSQLLMHARLIFEREQNAYNDGSSQQLMIVNNGGSERLMDHEGLILILESGKSHYPLPSLTIMDRC